MQFGMRIWAKDGADMGLKYVDTPSQPVSGKAFPITEGAKDRGFITKPVIRADGLIEGRWDHYTVVLTPQRSVLQRELGWTVEQLCTTEVMKQANRQHQTVTHSTWSAARLEWADRQAGRPVLTPQEYFNLL